VIYVEVLRAIYGMLVASMLWYKKFRKDLEGIGFKFNPYDPCVANRKVNGKQHTVRFHVDDLMSSHENGKVNEKFLRWLNRRYGKFGKVTATFGDRHDYLGMTIDFSKRGKVRFDMTEYVGKMLDSFPEKLRSTDVALTPSSENLYARPGSKQALDPERAKIFHTWVAKGLFVSKRGRMDIHPTIAGLCSHVREPTEGDWRALMKLMKYLNGTRKLVHTVSADNLRVIKWFVDASFAVHPDFRSHTGAVMTMGNGAMQAISSKQKLNTGSSTHAELVGASDTTTMILWTRLFLEAQGYTVEKNILYQDNKSAILLETNGRASAGKRSRALNIRYFFLTDQVERGNLSIEFCPTNEMVGDYMTKPLQGEKFRRFRNDIMGR